MEKDFSQYTEVLKRQDEVIFAYLFGSQARGKTTPLSDIDIGVYVENDIFKKKFPYGYESELSSKISSKKTVDIVILNKAPVLLRHRCVTEGKLLFCKNQALLNQFKVKTLCEYFDTQPLREKIKKAFYG